LLQRIEQAILKPQRFAERRTLRTEAPEICRMLGIARDCRPALSIRCRQHAASDAAIGAGAGGGANLTFAILLTAIS